MMSLASILFGCDEKKLDAHNIECRSIQHAYNAAIEAENQRHRVAQSTLLLEFIQKKTVSRQKI